MAATVLNGLMTFTHGDIVDRLVQGFPVRLVEVIDTREYLKISNRIYAAGPDSMIAALQITFPDPRGRWPWERRSKVAAFPLLGPVPAETDGTRKQLPR